METRRTDTGGQRKAGGMRTVWSLTQGLGGAAAIAWIGSVYGSHGSPTGAAVFYLLAKMVAVATVLLATIDAKDRREG